MHHHTIHSIAFYKFKDELYIRVARMLLCPGVPHGEALVSSPGYLFQRVAYMGRHIYRLWRPSPLYRAHRLEKALGTPAKIYYKYEGVSPAGSHSSNRGAPIESVAGLDGPGTPGKGRGVSGPWLGTSFITRP